MRPLKRLISRLMPCRDCKYRIDNGEAVDLVCAERLNDRPQRVVRGALLPRLPRMPGRPADANARRRSLHAEPPRLRPEISQRCCVRPHICCQVHVHTSMRMVGHDIGPPKWARAG